MAEFTWEARTRAGEVRRGVMDAENETAVNTRLRQQQLNPVQVRRRRSVLRLQIGSGVGTKELAT